MLNGWPRPAAPRHTAFQPATFDDTGHVLLRFSHQFPQMRFLADTSTPRMQLSVAEHLGWYDVSEKYTRQM
jgi:hypothetical protein